MISTANFCDVALLWTLLESVKLNHDKFGAQMYLPLVLIQTNLSITFETKRMRCVVALELRKRKPNFRKYKLVCCNE